MVNASQKEPTVASISFSDLINALPEEPAEFTAGTYRMGVNYVKPSYSKAGNFMYVVGLQSLEGPTKDRMVKYHVVLSPENPTSIKFFLEKLADLGVTQSYLASEPSTDDVAGTITRVGALNVTLKMREYDGREVPDVVKVKRPLQPQV